MPNITFVYNPGGNTVTFTDASTYPAGDDKAAINFIITDKDGKQVTAKMAGDDADDVLAVSTAGLDKSGGLYLQACIVTNKRLTGDGHANQTAVAALTGSLGSWKLTDHPIAYT